MTIEDDGLRDNLRALLDFRRTAIPDYATDSVVQARLGRVLADSAARIPTRPIGNWP